MLADAKEQEASDSSESSYDDHIDNMDEEEFVLNDSSNYKKGKAIRRKAAIDRCEDTNANDLEEQEDEADDTVFIDNLPKDEHSLKQMIKEVNYHIRDLEKQFFEEEDSEAEEELR